MVHQQGIQGAIEHYTHPERIAWQAMCATDEGIQKGEQWCKKCIWGNLLPEWKRAFESVDNIQSGEFIALWTARINHFADTYSVAPADAVVSAIPKDSARERTAVASTKPDSCGLMPHTFALASLSPGIGILVFHLPRCRHTARSSGPRGAHKKSSPELR
jgi:hypothetical protein